MVTVWSVWNWVETAGAQPCEQWSSKTIIMIELTSQPGDNVDSSNFSQLVNCALKA